MVVNVAAESRGLSLHDDRVRLTRRVGEVESVHRNGRRKKTEGEYKEANEGGVRNGRTHDDRWKGGREEATSKVAKCRWKDEVSRIGLVPSGADHILPTSPKGTLKGVRENFR